MVEFQMQSECGPVWLEVLHKPMEESTVAPSVHLGPQHLVACMVELAVLVVVVVRMVVIWEAAWKECLGCLVPPPGVCKLVDDAYMVAVPLPSGEHGGTQVVPWEAAWKEWLGCLVPHPGVCKLVDDAWFLAVMVVGEVGWKCVLVGTHQLPSSSSDICPHRRL